MNDKEISKLRTQLEEHLEWGVALEWHSSMFTELSQDIYSRCHVMISATTLKRFFGVVHYKGTPSTGTLDTLSQFIGYTNWRTFKLADPDNKKSKTIKNLPKKSLYITIGFSIALFMILLIGNKRVNDPEVLSTISFSSRTVTNSYPNSVVFDFDLQNIKSDSILIQQYWDANKTIQINSKQKQATGIYYFPGYFRAKLLVDGHITKEHDLFLRSEGWMGTLDYEPIPKYFTPNRTEEDGLAISNSLMKEVTTLERPVYSTFHYINDLGKISANNFTLNASLKVGWNDKWAVCQIAHIYVIGTKGAMIIPFSKVGCSSDNVLMLNDVFLNGKEHDLSVFGTDLSEFTKLKLTVDQKRVRISIEDVEVYTGQYFKSMGQFVGLRFKFLGIGEVESYSIHDPIGGQVILR